MYTFEMIWIFITIVFSYLLGSISSAVILSKSLFGRDIREVGSKNAGATNMLRTHGKKMGVLTLILDVLKGVIAVLLAMLIKNTISGNEYILRSLPFFAGLFVILGHNFPVFFNFKGGKGVATSLGVVLTLNYKIALIIAVIAISVMAITRYVSLGSILAGILYIATDITYMIFTDNFYLPELIFAILIAGLLIIRHRANIKRLLNGTENKLGQKKGENK